MRLLASKLDNHKLALQFAEYMVGGGLYFFSGLAIFAVLYSGLGWGWLPAKIVADAVGWTLNFFVQRYWAFASPKLEKQAARISAKYVVVVLANFAVDYLIVGGMKALGVTPYLGMLTSSAFFTFFNYLFYRFWVFRPARG